MKFIHSLLLCLALLLCACSKEKETSVADTVYKNAEKLYNDGDYDRAFTSFYEAYQGYTAEEKDRDAAYSLVFLAIIQTEKGDFLGSNENLSNALKLSGKDKTLLTSVYNQFAINHNLLQNQNEAVYWYGKALALTEDEFYQLNIRNNMAVAYLKMEQYAKAESLFKDIIDQPAIKDSVTFRNRVADNYAYSRFLARQDPGAESEMLTVMESRKSTNDIYGLSSSLSHLSDFYRTSDPRKAYVYAAEMYGNSRETGNADDQLQALGKMIDLQEGTQEKPLFEAYRKLSDSLNNARNRSRHHFTSIIYEAEKNKADLLSTRNEILTQRMVIFAMTIAVVLAVVFFLKWHRQQAYKNELAVRDTQLKYSKKVHDVVANGLYHTMVEIQNAENINRQKVLNRIEQLYEESRDIARDDLDTIEKQDFSERLYEMLNSYSSDRQRVLVLGNTPEIWGGLRTEAQTEIFYVLRELMVNMNKHSEAKIASIRFEQDSHALNIKYSDTGKGMNDGINIKKSGLRNMENRIVKLGGTITFDRNPSGGLATEILIPKN